MKKILLSVLGVSTYISIHAQCNELFISEYVEGSGNDKAMEIYNPTNSAINLSSYTINRYSNGSSSIVNTLQLTGTIAAHDAFVIANGQTTVEQGGQSPPASPALQALADQLDGPYGTNGAPMYMNGDDALTLEKSGVKVDIFGKIGEDPGTAWTNVFPYTDGNGTWITKDHTLQRKASVTGGATINPTAFNPLTEYDTLPENTWTGLGAHTCSCPTGINEMDNSISVAIYPNPSNAGFFNISSSEVIKTVELYNVMGQRVLQKEGNRTSKYITVETETLIKGVYVVKVLYANNRATVTRLSIQ